MVETRRLENFVIFVQAIIDKVLRITAALQPLPLEILCET